MIFQKATNKLFSKKITVSDYRIISSTKVRETQSLEAYKIFCDSCLHSAEISDKYYYKPDLVEVVCFIVSFVIY